MTRTVYIPVNDLQPPWHDSIGSLRSHVDKGPGQSTGARLLLERLLVVSWHIYKANHPRRAIPESIMSDDPPSSECSNPHHNPSFWHRPWNGATDGKWRMEHPRDIMTWNHNTSSCCGSEIASWNSRPLLPDMFFIKPISNQNHPIFSMYVHTNSFLVLTSSRRSFFIQKYDTHEVTPYPIPFCPSCSRAFQGLNLTIPLVNFEGVRIMANMTHMSRTLHWSWQDSKHAGEWPKDLERWGSISAGNLYSWPSYPIYLEV